MNNNLVFKEGSAYGFCVSSPMRRQILRFLIVMKLIAVFVVLFSMQLSANVLAQHVTLKVKNGMLPHVLEEIQRQTGYDFSYNDQLLRKSKKVDLELQNVPLEKALDKIFSVQPFSYEVVDNIIIIKNKLKTGKTGGLKAPSVDDVLVEQQDVVRGRVVDESSKPLVGASVRVIDKDGKRTSQQTLTDKEGVFLINGIQLDDLIVVTLLGFKNEEIKHNGQLEVNIAMKATIEDLEGVVVTGYNTIDKQSFTGTAVQIKKEDLLRVSSQNLITALQVFDPSLRVMDTKQVGSNPNALPEFYVRGQSGFPGVMELDQLEEAPVSQFALKNNPNLPIFILDGFEAGLEKIYDLNLNRINQITILKDAAATAMYGSRASNGVVVIETIAPKPGQIRATYQTYLDITAPDLSSYHLMNAQEKLDAEELAGIFRHHPNKPVDQYYESSLATLQWYKSQKQNMILKGVDTYWLSQPLSVMFNNRHNLYIEGGSEAFRTGVELRYDVQNGVMKESGRKRTGAGISVEYRHKGLQIRNQTFLDLVQSEDSPYGSFSDFSRLQPYDAIRDEEGKLIKTQPFWQGLQNVVNPVYEASLGSFKNSNYKEFTDNLSANWFINNYFTIRGQFAIAYKTGESKRFLDPASASYKSDYSNEDRGSLTIQNDQTLSWNTNLFMTFNRSIGDHNFNIAAGFNAKLLDYNYASMLYRGFPSGQLSSPAYAYRQEGKTVYNDNKTRLVGSFANLNYTLRNIYLFDGSFRVDGSSEFGATRRWAPFWSLGTGINLHHFLQDQSTINILRIRANIGQTGKSNFAPYMANTTYQIMTDNWYPTGIGAELKYMGNKALTWEKQISTNIGVDLTIKNRYTLEFNYYHKATYDLISDVTIPSSLGFTVYRDNVGKVLNKGFELIGNFRVYSDRDWDLVLFGNMAHNRNRIVEIAESMKQYNERVDAHYEEYKEMSRSAYEWLEQNNDLNLALAKPVRKFEEGSSLTSIYGMRSLGINPADGQEVYLKRGGDVTRIWSPYEQDVIGNTEPILQGAWGINLRYRQFSLYTTFLYSMGGDIYNDAIVRNIENLNLLYYNGDVRVLTDRWQEPGDIAPLKSIQDRHFVTRPTSRFVQRENYLAFNSFSLMYDVKTSVAQRYGLQGLRFGFNMNDIARFSTVREERGLSYPFARTFSFNLNLTF